MLIKFIADDERAKIIRRFTAQATGSKAYERAAELALELDRKWKDALEDVDRLEAELAVYKQIVEGARSAATLLITKISEGHSELYDQRHPKGK